MENKNKIKFLSGYLAKVYPLISFLILFNLSYLSIFLFADLKIEYWWLGFEITIFIALIYLFVSFLRFKKDVNLKEKLTTLEEQLKYTTAEYIHSKNELENYFAMWAHQIKTPITASLLMIGNENNEHSEKLKLKLMQINEYTNMAINYLKLSNHSTDLDFTSVELDKVIKSILKQYSLLFIDKHDSVQYEDIGVSVISDTKWLTILIEQLVSNAVKYTENGNIHIYYDKTTNRLYIDDTGIGISEADLPKIFDRGYSGYNGRLTEKSSGLGLFLVKLISKRISVKVSIDSKLGEGTSACIDFDDIINSYNYVRNL